jgi:hypothetical protein
MPMTSRTKRLLRAAAPTLLVLIALNQIYLARTHDLTPWKGGGFGMFSTVDEPNMRWLVCRVTANGREVAVALPDAVRDDERRERAMPSHARLQKIARIVARARWVNRDFDANDENDPCAKKLPQVCSQPIPGCESLQPGVRAWQDDEREPKPSELAPVTAVRVELWRARFDLATRSMRSWRADQITVPVGASRG